MTLEEIDRLIEAQQKRLTSAPVTLSKQQLDELFADVRSQMRSLLVERARASK